MGRFKRLRGRRLAAVLAIVLVPATAWAWKETQGRAFVVQQGSGCIQQLQSVTHQGSTGLMTIASQAITIGTSDNGLCQSTGGNKYIRGDQSLFLVKRIQGQDPSDPNDTDTWSLCKIENFSGGWTQGLMTAQKVYSDPPCGPGFYALVSCMISVDTYVQGLAGGVRLGWFDAADVTRDCLITPRWHPAFDNPESDIGPEVVLF